MFNPADFWKGYATLMAESVFMGVVGAHAFLWLCKLTWRGLVYLWDKYSDRIY